MKLFNKIKKVITALIVSVAVFFSGQVFLPANFLHVKAAEVNNFDKSLVTNDLSDIDISNYPKDESAKPSVIRFMEYCYSEKLSMAENYGLYVYLYNPTEQEINTSSVEVNMAKEYNEKGEPSSYDNLSLIFLNKTENNRFYKFKVTDSISFLSLQKKYMSDFFCRRYDISGIQLKFGNGTVCDTKDLSISKKFIFTGYGSGCGSNSESTLKCTVSDFETLKLDVGHTNYRFDNKITGVYDGYELRDELNTVYFTVPRDTVNKYGNLQRVKSEWYEYKTKPVFVTKDSGAYNWFYGYIGKSFSTIRKSSNPSWVNDIPWRVYWEEDCYGWDGITYWTYKKGLNGEVHLIMPNAYADFVYDLHDDYKDVDYLYYLFERQNVEDLSGYEVNSSEMMNWIYDFKTNFEGKIDFQKDNFIDINGRSIYRFLFESSIDEDRIKLLDSYKDGNEKLKNGHITQEIDAGDKGNIYQNKEQSYWDFIWHGKKNEEISYNPILEVEQDDINRLFENNLSKSEFCKNYYISEKDFEVTNCKHENCFPTDCKKDIKSRLESAKKNNEIFYLFRFAVTDYYSSPAYFDDAENYGKGISSDLSSKNGYVAQETVFLDFDIISLTFRKDSVDTVISVVSDPFDIINGLDPPQNLTVKNDNWLMKILAIVALILVLVILGPFISPILTIAFNLLGKLIAVLLKALALIFKFIWSILTFPFRLLKPK